jgi:heme/copper-type cytochrome/quinol oxidase subunit 2
MKLVLLALAVAGLIGGYFYLSQPPAASETMSQPLPTDQPPTNPSVTTPEVMVIDLEAGSFYYTPNTITVKKGTPVKIVMTSVDMMHDFVIDELDVKLPIVQSGNTGEIEFIPETVGEFEYYCSVGEHRANGQVGTLIVTE